MVRPLAGVLGALNGTVVASQTSYNGLTHSHVVNVSSTIAVTRNQKLPIFSVSDTVNNVLVLAPAGIF
jgi:hypothetical protein